MFFQIPCRCVLKTYRKWSYIHKINVPFKDNKSLNKRWDTRNHLFYQQVSNGNLFPKENISSKGNENNMGAEN